jgi:hypothetical protein
MEGEKERERYSMDSVWTIVSVFLNIVLLYALFLALTGRQYFRAVREGEVSGHQMADRPRFRRFIVVRDDDVSGVSGTGVVCEGVQFSDKHAAVHWLGKWPMTTPHHQGVKTIKAIHGHGGKTRVVWLDPA